MKIFLIKFFQKYKVTPGEKTNMGIAEVDIITFDIIDYVTKHYCFSLTLINLLPSKGVFG